METALIVFSSSTSGSRLKNLSQKAQIRDVRITQTPASIKAGGCSYSLRVNLHDLDNILTLAARYKVSYVAVYREDIDISGSKVYVRL